MSSKNKQLIFTSQEKAIAEFEKKKGDKKDWTLIKSKGKFYLESGSLFIRNFETVVKKNY